MRKDKKRAIVISVTSDIGTALAQRWSRRGWEVFGTYRTMASRWRVCQKNQMKLVKCDLLSARSVKAACAKLAKLCRRWDVLVLCPGIQEPIGPFEDCDFHSWARSIEVNFTAQMKIVHALLPFRRAGSAFGPCVLFFAGGGTNNATVNTSAYTASKIGLIKMCELLDAEIPDTRFAIVGPGWVKTKIHQAILKARTAAPENYKRTKARMSSNRWTPMDRVCDCCDWVVDSDKDTVSGRNFSVVFDRWSSGTLTRQLRKHPDMYKLRRCGNDWRSKGPCR